MRQRLEEPRQVRKEAAVFAMVVCCGVPGLFCICLSLFFQDSWVCLAWLGKDKHKVFYLNEDRYISSHCPKMEAETIF